MSDLGRYKKGSIEDKMENGGGTKMFLLILLIIIFVITYYQRPEIYKKNTENINICEKIEEQAKSTAQNTPQSLKQTTQASYYDYTLNGIPWGINHRTAASREFERGTIVEVTNIENGKTVEVLINDYGPDESVHPDRALDLSSHAFELISNKKLGVITVEYQAIGKGEYYPINK